MLRVEKYKGAHLKELLKHPSQVVTRQYVLEEHADGLEKNEYGFSVLRGEECIACIGLMKYWEGRYEAWAFLIPGHRDAFLFIHKKVLRFLKNTKIRRVEATVDRTFKAGVKWALALGFHCEAPILKAFGPTGREHSLWVRVRED